MFQALADPNTARNIAAGATLVCVWLAAHYAQKVREHRPRAFTALSLLALNWAILMLYYLPGAPEEEILSSFGGFVLIIVGALLYREAVADAQADGPSDGPTITWLDTLPLFLFRSTVLGFGVYYLVKVLFHVEYGWGTLALALWGTVLSILGYLSVWLGLVYLYRHRAACLRVARLFGLLIAVYSGAEIAFAVWYARDYWPPYHRYLALQARQGAPDLRALLPFHPEPDWPDAPAWSRLATIREHGEPVPRIVGLRAQPRVPDPWAWLTHLFSVLKLVFTVALLELVLALPPHDPRVPPLRLHRWLARRLHLGQ